MLVWIICYMIFEIMIVITYFTKFKKYYVKEIYAHIELQEELEKEL